MRAEGIEACTMQTEASFHRPDAKPHLNFSHHLCVACKNIEKEEVLLPSSHLPLNDRHEPPEACHVALDWTSISSDCPPGAR